MNETQYVSEINGYKIKDSEARNNIGDLTNLTTTEKSSVVGAINEVDDKVNDIGNFSGNEVNTGEIWIDGKTIYRKVIDMGTLPDSTEKAVPHYITNLDYIIDAYGCAKRESDGVQFPLPYVDVLNDHLIELVLTSTTVNIRTDIDRTNLTKCYIIMEYTKTSE